MSSKRKKSSSAAGDDDDDDHDDFAQVLPIKEEEGINEGKPSQASRKPSRASKKQPRSSSISSSSAGIPNSSNNNNNNNSSSSNNNSGRKSRVRAKVEGDAPVAEHKFMYGNFSSSDNELLVKALGLAHEMKAKMEAFEDRWARTMTGIEQTRRGLEEEFSDEDPVAASRPAKPTIVPKREDPE